MAAADAAAQTGSVRLTLDEAVSRGLAASDRLDELSARQEGARAVEDQRKAAGRPQLAARGSYIRTNHVQEFSLPSAVPGVRLLIYPDLPNNVQTGVDLQWPIYTAGRVSGLTRAAGAEVEAAGARSRRRACRSEARNHAIVLGGDYRAGGGRRRAAGPRPDERAPYRRAQSVGRRARSAERCPHDRSAAGASKDAEHRGGQHRRVDVGRVPAPGRP